KLDRHSILSDCHGRRVFQHSAPITKLIIIETEADLLACLTGTRDARNLASRFRCHGTDYGPVPIGHQNLRPTADARRPIELSLDPTDNELVTLFSVRIHSPLRQRFLSCRRRYHYPRQTIYGIGAIFRKFQLNPSGGKFRREGGFIADQLRRYLPRRGNRWINRKKSTVQGANNRRILQN